MEVMVVSEGDPTDEALATIASILDQPETPRGGKGAAKDDPVPSQDAPTGDDAPTTAPAIEAHGYAKTGPGPMDAIRFKWTVRRADDGDYYVDETIGEASVPVVSGPMTAEAAVRWVDDRESEAQQRFDRLRSEMAARTDEVELIRLGGGDV
jgi:hypothetical protein